MKTKIWGKIHVKQKPQKYNKIIRRGKKIEFVNKKPKNTTQNVVFNGTRVPSLI